MGVLSFGEDSMPGPRRVRALTDEERLALERLARARKAATRLTERARILWSSSRGEFVEASAERLGTCAHTVRRGITRFTTSGLAGVDAAARRGRPTPSWPEDVAEVIALSLTTPQTLELPFASWTLGRLAADRKDMQGSAINRARMSALLVAEG
jgi:transposase